MSAVRNDESGRFEATHGLYDHPFYHVWVAMINRCHNESDVNYHRYGARGIRVCDAWRDEPTHCIEWLEQNGYGKGLQLDRIDNDGEYSPENCQVVTRSENCRNRRDNVRYLVHGESLIAKEVEEKYGVKAGTFRARVVRGLSPEEALINKRKLPQFEWEIDGEMLSSKDVEAKFGVPRQLFTKRLGIGMSAERAAKTPVRD